MGYEIEQEFATLPEVWCFWLLLACWGHMTTPPGDKTCNISLQLMHYTTLQAAVSQQCGNFHTARADGTLPRLGARISNIHYVAYKMYKVLPPRPSPPSILAHLLDRVDDSSLSYTPSRGWTSIVLPPVFGFWETIHEDP
jgi:hypothetical protein